MLQLLTCAKGHSWETNGGDIGKAECPVCGDAVDLLPLFDLAMSSDAPGVAPEPVLPQAPPLRDAAGKPVVAGFDVQEDLGRTMQGVRLFRAKQLLVNRSVLLKVVVARDDAGQTGWGSLRGEAAALGRLCHPNIIPILEAGERDRQLFYNALEWVDGPTLAEHAAGKPLPPRQAVLLVEVLARAVHAAHEQGVVHRGLRPSCVRLQPQPGAGEGKPGPVGPPFWVAGASCVLPRIGDFGLARRPVDGDAADLELHEDAPSCLSPEQAWGRGREIGPATDVYALGAVLYELLAGKPAYRGRTPGETLDFIRSGEAPWLSRVNKRLPADLAAVCRKAMHRRPSNRYKSALELAEDLRAFASGRPVRARVPGVGARVGKWARRRPAVALLLLVCLSAAGAVLTAYLYSADDAARYQTQLASAQSRTTAAEGREAGLRKELVDARKREQIAAYYHTILLADRETAAGRTTEARQLLDDCPAELRHWEWQYLNDRLVHPEHSALTLRGPEQPVTCIAFSPDGRRLAASSGAEPQEVGGAGPKRAVHVWTLPRPTTEHQMTGFVGVVRRVAFSPDGGRLATVDGALDQFGGVTGAVKEWGTSQDRELSSRGLVGGRPTDAAYSADGKRLVILDEHGRIYSFSVNTPGEQPTALGGGELWNSKASRLVLLNAEGMKAATVAAEGNWIQIYDTLRVWAPVRAARHQGDILALAFSPETNLLASGGRDAIVQVWDAQANQLVCTCRGHSAAVTGISFSRDGRRLATSGEDGAVRIWDPFTGQEILRLTPFDKDAAGGNGVAAVQFSPAEGDWQLATVHGNEVRIFGPQRPL